MRSAIASHYYVQVTALRRVALILYEPSEQRALMFRNGGILYRGVYVNVGQGIVGLLLSGRSRR